MMKLIEEHELYDVWALELTGNHKDRKFSSNIDGNGNVHLNVHEPGAMSGGHYHMKVREYFVNPGPGLFLLHLRHPETRRTKIVDMIPASLSEIRIYRAKWKVKHTIENPEAHRATLIIIVNEDDPKDVFLRDDQDIIEQQVDILTTFVKETGQARGTVSWQMALGALKVIRDKLDIRENKNG